MDDLTNQFIQIREYIKEHIRGMSEVYFTEMWDPLVKFMLIKETNKLLKNLMKHQFPDFPKKYFPKIKFRIFDEEREVEGGVQTYFNETPDLIFLGTSLLESSEFDFYICKSWDPNSEYMFFARYGHMIDNVYSGAKVAAAEYFTGVMTPLSVAFGMAVEAGFII